MAHHTCINLLRTYDHDDESALVSYFPLTFNRFPGTRTRRQQQHQRIRQHHGRGGEERSQQGQKLGRWRRRRPSPILGTLATMAALVGGGVYLTYAALYDVQPGHVAILYSRISGIKDDIVEPGTHFTTFHRETYHIRRPDAPRNIHLDRLQRLVCQP